MQASKFHHRGGKVLALIAGLSLAGSVGLFAGHLTASPNGAVAAMPAASPTAVDMAPGFPDVAKAVRPAVVNITPAKTLVRERGKREGGDPMDRMEEFFGIPKKFFGPRGHGPSERGPFDREPHGGGMGSGVIVSPDGDIITNNHVVGDAKEVQVTLPDKREFTGKVVGNDPKTDLAVVKIDGRDLPSVQWGDSAKLQVGEYVLAVGNPFGLNSTVTLGIVSALGRGRMGITQYEDFIQTDAAINPGNSGGALVSDVTANSPADKAGLKNGDVILEFNGKNVRDSRHLKLQVAQTAPGKEVPVKISRDGKIKDLDVTLKEVPSDKALAKAQNGKASEQDVLDGITVDDLSAEVRKQYEVPSNVKGVIITDVDPNSVAYEAGLREGAVIQEIDRKPVKNAEEAVAMSDLKGKSVLLRVWSRGGSHFVVVKPDNEKTG